MIVALFLALTGEHEGEGVQGGRRQAASGGWCSRWDGPSLVQFAS